MNDSQDDKVLAAAALLAILIMAGMSYWASWLMAGLFDYTISTWIVFIFLFVYRMALDKKFRGIPFVLLTLGTLYYLFI